MEAELGNERPIDSIIDVRSASRIDSKTEVENELSFAAAVLCVALVTFQGSTKVYPTPH